MGSWCAENLRDAQEWASQQLSMKVESDEAAKLFDAAIRQLVSWIDCDQLGGIEATLRRMFETEPDFLMGKVLKLGLDCLGTRRSLHVDATFDRELNALVSDANRRGNPRERKHAKAVQLFAKGEMQRACEEWENILTDHPNDLLALKFAHTGYFYTGDNLGKKESVARLVDKWDRERWPCHNYLHGMYAFGLEECGEFKEAEKHALLGLRLQRQDCWSMHALAHCLEMSSDFNKGIHLLESTVSDWAPCKLLAGHNYWHNALFYIEKGDFDSALSIYDKELAPSSKWKESEMLHLVDAASLLTRLELQGFDVGRRRWMELAPMVEPHIHSHVLAFNDAHFSMVLSRLEEANEGKESQLLADSHAESISNFVGGKKSDIIYNENARIMLNFGETLCSSIVAFNAGKYEQAFDELFAIRTQLHRMGGSHAQRDVFIQFLIYAGLRSGDKLRRENALAVLQERGNCIKNSSLAERMIQMHRQH